MDRQLKLRYSPFQVRIFPNISFVCPQYYWKYPKFQYDVAFINVSDMSHKPYFSPPHHLFTIAERQCVLFCPCKISICSHCRKEKSFLSMMKTSYFATNIPISQLLAPTNAPLITWICKTPGMTGTWVWTLNYRHYQSIYMPLVF